MIINSLAAKQIQRIIRGFLGRRSMYAPRLRTLTSLPFQSAVKIQACVRRWRAIVGQRIDVACTTHRLEQVLAKKMLKVAVREAIVIPAAMLLQRIWHSFKGRRKAAKRRQALTASVQVQRVVRGFMDRRKVKRKRIFVRQTVRIYSTHHRSLEWKLTVYAYCPESSYRH